MAFDPQEARDNAGRWTRGGSDELPRGVIDTRATDVSGDVWNTSTAKRLETEYAAVRPDLDAIVQKGIEAGDEVETTRTGANGWEEDVSGSDQEAAETAYKDAHYQSNYDAEVESWQNSGSATADAKYNLSEDDEFKTDWLADFISSRTDNDEERIPYTAQQLSDAIEIKAGEEGSDDPDITFNDDFLSEPDNLNPNFSAAQLALPGIDVPMPDGKASLTPAMREDIIKSLTEAFNDKAEKNSSDVPVPDYISEQATESTAEEWSNMSDDDKLSWTKDNTDIISEDNETTNTGALELPTKFDPLNETSGEDYKKTQAIAKYLSDQRAAQLITDRIGNAKWKPRSEFLGSDADYEKLYGPGGVGAKKDEAWTQRMLGLIQSVDNKLWSGWKGSSTGNEGKILQVAAADELGGRLREAKQDTNLHPRVYNTDTAPDGVLAAGAVIKNPTAYAYNETENAKAVMKAYTTGAPMNVVDAYVVQAAGADSKTYSLQQMMDAAKTISAYFATTKPSEKEMPALKSEAVGGYIRLPEVSILRNGAASTTISRDVANGWNGTTNYAPSGIDKKAVIAEANDTFKSIGGYEGVKAAVRAKWETTQYLLDRADMPLVQVYRGITLPHTLDGATQTGEFNPPSSGIVKGFTTTDDLYKTLTTGKTPENGDMNLATMKIGDKIKIASGKTITKVSEDTQYGTQLGKWTYSEPANPANRIVMRAEVPRTAVVSVPAYGVNVKSEQEVVVVGTAWRNWDAWSGRAPSFDSVPIGAKPAGNKDEAIAQHTSDANAEWAKESAEIDQMIAEKKAKVAA